jgi:hypothetical protein
MVSMSRTRRAYVRVRLASLQLRAHSMSVARDGKRRYALVVRGLLFGQVYDLRVGSVRFDRLNALVGTFLGLVPLAGGDDFAVGRLEVEPKLAGFVLADLGLGCYCSSPRWFPEQRKRYHPRTGKRCAGQNRIVKESS